MTDTPDARPELLPCPFCGAAMMFVSPRDGDDYHAHPKNKCVLGGDTTFLADPLTIWDSPVEIAAWNRRLAAPVQPQKHEANSIHLGSPSGHDESAQLPETGWRWVPEKPTQAMLWASLNVIGDNVGSITKEWWAAMLAAAPLSGLHESAQAVEPTSSFDKFMDSYTQELIDTPDADILDGKDPAQVLAEGRIILRRALDKATEKPALASFNVHFFKCSPSCSVVTWTAAFRKGVEWAFASPRRASPPPGSVDTADKAMQLAHLALDDSEALESKAREIYESWRYVAGWVPWVDGGNSLMQDKARRSAARWLARFGSVDTAAAPEGKQL